MRVLFLSGWFPYPPDNGSKIRVFNLIKQLSRKHEVTLLTFAQGSVSKDRLTEMEFYCQSVHVVPYVEFEPKRLRAILGFFSPRPRSVVDIYSPEMHAMVREVDKGNSFDIVIASQLRSAPYALLLKRPRIFEEVELTVIREQFTRQRDFIRKVRYGLTWHKLSHFMAKLLYKFDGCTVVSEREWDNVLKIAPTYCSVAVVPNGVDLDFYTGDFGAPEPNTLIHTGVLTYDANFDAVDFFLSDIFPLLEARQAGVTLRITGKTNGVAVGRLPQCEGVIFTGYLDDIRSAVAQSWACVVPLQVGGGTRLKILEAMALGTPVVSTSKGAEGLEVTHEENILIADAPADFAQAVIHLLGDENLRAKLSANGRRLVEERYSWEMCARPLEQLLYQVMEQ